MEANKIAQLRAFENIVKKRIIEDYGTYLSDEKKNMLLNNTNIPDDFEYAFTGPSNIQGVITRLVCNQFFSHIECTKNIDLSDGTKPAIPYGEYLKKGLVSFFSKELAQKHSINIDSVPELLSNEELVKNVSAKLQTNFLPLVFSCDANALLAAVNNPEITKQIDKEAVKHYIQSKNAAKANETSLNIRGRVLPPIYIDGVQHIKYIDENEQVHLIKTINPNKVSQAYKEMISAKLPGEEIDAEKFLQTLKKLGENIPIFNSSKLSSSESSMLNTIYGDRNEVFKNSPELAPAANNVTSTNEAVRLISEEEYLKIINKEVNGHKLTEEDLTLLSYYDQHNFGSENMPNPTVAVSQPQVAAPIANTTNQVAAAAPAQVNTTNNEQQMVMSLQPKGIDGKKSGFAQKYLPVFLVLVTIAIGVIVGIALFKVKSMF